MSLKPCGPCHYIDIWRRVLPGSYTEPIEQENQGAGFDVPRSQAVQWAYFEEQANLSQQAYFLRTHSTQTAPPASSARKARGVVRFTRSAPTSGVIVIPEGTEVQAWITDSVGAPLLVARFVVLADTTLPESSAPVDADVEAIFPGYDANVWANTITRFGELASATVPAALTSASTAAGIVTPSRASDAFQAGFLGRYVRISAMPALATFDSSTPRRITQASTSGITFDPPLDAADVGRTVTVYVLPWDELGISLTNPDPTADGVADALGAAATDRGAARQTGEDDLQFARRLQLLADIVSPSAIENLLTRVLTPVGIRWRLIETRDADGLGGFIYDQSAYDYGQVAPLPSMPGDEVATQGAVYLSEGQTRRYFIILVSPSGEGEFGFPYSLGDVPPFAVYDLPEDLGGGAYDGFPVVFVERIALLWEEVRAIKAAGVGFSIVLDPTL